MKQRAPQQTREIRLLDHALAAFTRTTRLPARVVAYERKHRTGPDAVIQIAAQGKRLRLFAEVKTVDRPVGLAIAKRQLEPYGKQGILIAPYLTPELANHCHKLGLNFIDAAGNAYVEAPGLLVFIRGERQPTLRAMTGGTRGAGTATALRVIFALLCKPALVDAPYRDVAAAADVALGTVGWVFYDLQHRGYILGGVKARHRLLTEPAHLLDEWVTNFPIKLRPKLNPRRFQAPDAGWWQEARLEGGAWWGGEVAAAKLTNYLKPATCTIYLDAAKPGEVLDALIKRHRLRADPRGNVEVLDTFWRFEAKAVHPDIVPPLIVYADLMATLDPRNLEVAKRIREDYLDNALGRT